MVVTRMPAAKLIRDYSVYPRPEIDDANVKRLVEALEAGVTLPPVVADKKTLILSDGWHRQEAHLRHFGPTADIDVELKNYADKAELFWDACHRNAMHGRSLTRFDQTRILIIGQELGLTKERIADALSVTKERLDKLEARKMAFGPDEKPVAIKQTISHLAGEQLTALQSTGLRRAGGMTPVFYVNQIINLLESDLLDTENSRLMERLARLHDLLRERMLVAA